MRLVGVEASGHGLDTEKHAATLTKGTPGVLHGSFSFLLQDSEGQIIDPHSISAGCAALAGRTAEPSPGPSLPRLCCCVLCCLGHVWQVPVADAALANSTAAVSRLNEASNQPSFASPRVSHGAVNSGRTYFAFRYPSQNTREKGWGNLQRCVLRRLDYPGIGPEHSFFKECGRAEYAAATDAEALEAFRLVSRTEGIIPALETSHAFSYLEVRPLSYSDFDLPCVLASMHLLARCWMR